MISLCGTSINAPPWEGREHGSERQRRKRGSLRRRFSALRPSLEHYERRRKKRGSINLAHGLRTLTEICVICGSLGAWSYCLSLSALITMGNQLSPKPV